MSRSNTRWNPDDYTECWSLRMLRRFREHTAWLAVIYEDLRPLGKGFVKFTALPFGCFASLDVLEQVVVALLM